MNRTREILQLCDAWRAAYVRPDGSGVEDVSTRAYRLLSNGIKFHELDIDELQAACIGLTETMVPRGLGGFICQDHHQFWGWCGQLILMPSVSNLLSTSGAHIQQLFESSFCLIVGGDSHYWAEPEVQLSKDYDWCLHRLIGRKYFILKYLAYPLLETLLKVHCCNFIQDDGTVISQFSARQSDGRKRTYKTGQRCSSFRDLFVLLEQNVAGSELLDALQRLGNYFSRIDSNSTFLGLLYKWRNATLHGASEVTAVSGISFNLCLLLCMDLIRPSYRKLQLEAVDNVINGKAARLITGPIYYHNV